MPPRPITDRDLAEILAGHIQWLESKGAEGGPADLSGLDLNGRDLRRQPLFRANFAGSDLRGADLSGAMLVDCNFEGTNCNGAIMRDVDLRMTNLTTTAEFRDVQLIGANLTDADLSGVALGKAHLMDTQLVRANLRGCHALGESLFINSNFTDADLREADFFMGLFTQATLAGTKLGGAKLQQANFEHADLTGADFTGANLIRAEFFNARAAGAIFDGADLTYANFSSTELEGARFRQARMPGARFIACNLANADLSGAHVYGVSAWNVVTEGATQNDLVVTHPKEAAVTVDDLEIAQFVYLLLNREKIRNLLDVITSKAVLVLGRFTPERKRVLDGIAGELRARNLLPIIFDFDRSTNRDFTETIKTLSGLCMFVIVDLTNPKSAPLELQASVPDYQIPFVPIIEEGQEPFSMFNDLGKYDWVLKPVVTYVSLEMLIAAFDRAIVDRAFDKHKELQSRKARQLETVSAGDFLRPPSA